MKIIHAPANDKLKEQLRRKIKKLKETANYFYGSQEVFFHTGQAHSSKRRKITEICNRLGITRKKYKKMVKRQRAVKWGWACDEK